MVRGGNEDAFALVHAAEAHAGESGEHALVLVADGMGGSAAGEVAAALAVQALRHHGRLRVVRNSVPHRKRTRTRGRVLVG